MQPVTGVGDQTGRKPKLFVIWFLQKMKSFFSKHRKKKVAALIIAAVAIFIVLTGLGQDGGIRVSTGTVVQDAIEQTVFGTAKLEVKQKQTFYSVNSTTIEEVVVQAGQKVSKGQVILRTDDSALLVDASKNKLAYKDFQAKLVNSESNIRLYEQDYNLLKKKYEIDQALYEEGAVSREELEETEQAFTQAQEKLLVEREANLPLLQSQLEQARLAWEKAEEQLSKAVVISPLDGVLLNLPVKKGQRVEQGALLAEIGDPANLEIETGINEIDAAVLNIGDSVEITNSTLLSEPLKGQVEYIAPIAELIKTSQGDQSQVKIKIAIKPGSSDNNLKPGYNVNFKIILEQKDQALLAPYEAVVKKDNLEFVYVVGPEGLVAEREVKTGLSNELFFEITSGLTVGEVVVLNPDQQIKDGVKVTANAASK